MPSNARLFVALTLTGACGGELSQYVETLQHTPGIRWVPRNRYHITLAFLGDVPTSKIAQLADAIAKAAKATQCFDVVLGGLGSFPNGEQPQVLWIGVSEGMKELRSLQTRVSGQLMPLGFVRDTRGFLPHVTLGRFDSSSDHGSITHTLANTQVSNINVKVNQVCIFSSSWDRPRSELTYQQIAALPLGTSMT